VLKLHGYRSKFSNGSFIVFLSIAQLVFEPLVPHLLGLRPTGSRAAGAPHEFPDLFYGISIMSCQIMPSAQPDLRAHTGILSVDVCVRLWPIF
jgi:hypothetical protein